MPSTIITDFAGLQAWISARNGQTTWTEDEVALIDSAAIQVNSSVTLNPGGSGFRAVIRPAPGREITGRLWPIYGTRATIYTRDFAGLTLQSTRAVVEGVQLSRNNSDGGAYTLQGGARIERCILDQGSSNNTLVNDSGGAGSKIVASLLVGKSGGGFLADGNAGLNLDRCTLVANGTTSAVRSNFGALGSAGSAYYGFTTDFTGSSLGGTHNATSNGSFSGTGFGTSGQTDLVAGDFVSVSSGSEDYRAAASSTKLADSGVAISGVTVDLFGSTIPLGSGPGIGAVEVAGGGGGGTAATSLVVTVPDAAGLTGYSAAVWSTSTPTTGSTVIRTATGLTFNGSGQVTIDITGLGIPIGARRWVTLTNSNGDPAQTPAPKQASGPVTAS